MSEQRGLAIGLCFVTVQLRVSDMTAKMFAYPIKPIHRLVLGPFCCSILWGCVSPAITPAPTRVPTAADTPAPAPAAPAQASSDPKRDRETLRTTSVASLTPDQAIDERQVGKRIRWAGGVHHMTRTDEGVCLTLAYVLSDEDGAPRWTANSTDQTFKACTTGVYDPELVQNFSNVTIIGRILGKADIGMGGGSSVGPVVEIEKLYRWSDCLAGDTSPVCKSGFLTSQAVTDP